MTSQGEVPIGYLAAALRAAISDVDTTTARLRAIELNIEVLLESLYPDWSPLFPTNRAWQFSDPDGIHVFGVLDSPAAATALNLAGFRRVTAHSHLFDPDRVHQVGCRCETRVSDVSGAV